MKFSEYVKKLKGGHWTQHKWFNQETGCMCIGAELIDAFTDINIHMIINYSYDTMSSSLGLTDRDLSMITHLNDQAPTFDMAKYSIIKYLESIGK